MLVDTVFSENVDCGKPGGCADRIAVCCAANKGVGGFALSSGVRTGEYFCTTTDGREWIPAADRFAVYCEIRYDAVFLLGASPGDPESGNDFVVDQDDTVCLSGLSERLQKSRLRC